MLLAKNKPALINLADQFGPELTHKTYLALVTGFPAEDSFDDNAKLGQHPTRLGYVRVDEKNGKNPTPPSK